MYIPYLVPPLSLILLFLHFRLVSMSIIIFLSFTSPVFSLFSLSGVSLFLHCFAIISIYIYNRSHTTFIMSYTVRRYACYVVCDVARHLIIHFVICTTTTILSRVDNFHSGYISTKFSKHGG